MFGTLRYNRQTKQATFIDQTDSFLNETAAEHSACDACRARKVACSSRRAGCDRCNAVGIQCTYSPVSHGRNGQQRRRGTLNSQTHAAAPGSKEITQTEEQGEDSINVSVSSTEQHEGSEGESDQAQITRIGSTIEVRVTDAPSPIAMVTPASSSPLGPLSAESPSPEIAWPAGSLGLSLEECLVDIGVPEIHLPPIPDDETFLRDLVMPMSPFTADIDWRILDSTPVAHLPSPASLTTQCPPLPPHHQQSPPPPPPSPSPLPPIPQHLHEPDTTTTTNNQPEYSESTSSKPSQSSSPCGCLQSIVGLLDSADVSRAMPQNGHGGAHGALDIALAAHKPLIAQASNILRCTRCPAANRAEHIALLAHACEKMVRVCEHVVGVFLRQMREVGATGYQRESDGDWTADFAVAGGGGGGSAKTAGIREPAAVPAGSSGGGGGGGGRNSGSGSSSHGVGSSASGSITLVGRYPADGAEWLTLMRVLILMQLRALVDLLARVRQSALGQQSQTQQSPSTAASSGQLLLRLHEMEASVRRLAGEVADGGRGKGAVDVGATLFK